MADRYYRRAINVSVNPLQPFTTLLLPLSLRGRCGLQASPKWCMWWCICRGCLEAYSLISDAGRTAIEGLGADHALRLPGLPPSRRLPAPPAAKNDQLRHSSRNPPRTAHLQNHRPIPPPVPFPPPPAQLRGVGGTGIKGGRAGVVQETFRAT